MYKKLGLLAALTFIVSVGVFGFRVRFPASLIFDESYYVSAAREVLKDGVNQNWSHPPLGKWLISRSMATFGQNPFGTRAFSVLFGAGAVVAIELLAYFLYGDLWLAAAVALLTLTNGMLFVMARVAMLDVFMIFFMLAGLAVFAAARRETVSPRARLLLFSVSGLCFGLATECKWIGIFPVFVCLALSLKKNWRQALVAFVAIPVVVYASVFGILLMHMHSSQGVAYSFSGELLAQWDMLTAHLDRLPFYHAYANSWIDWPLNSRPTLFSHTYAYFGEDWKSNVIFFLLNPVIAWTGFSALFLILWKIWRRDERSLFVGSLFFICWLPWAALNRSTFLFYYFAAASFLPLVIVDASTLFPRRRQAVFCLVLLNVIFFIYLWPILASQSLFRSQITSRLWLFPNASF